MLNFHKNLTLEGAGGAGALQTSCAREKAEAGCRLLRHVATGKQCCLSWSLRPGYGFVSIPKSRFLQKKTGVMQFAPWNLGREIFPSGSV